MKLPTLTSLLFSFTLTLPAQAHAPTDQTGALDLVTPGDQVTASEAAADLRPPLPFWRSFAYRCDALRFCRWLRCQGRPFFGPYRCPHRGWVVDHG